MSLIQPLLYVLPPENIVLLKFILESYEGLAVLRTLDPEKGEVVILGIEDTLADLRALLLSITPEINLQPLPAPSSLAQDWLTSEDDSLVQYLLK